MEQLKIALRMMRAGAASGKDCGYLRLVRTGAALRSSSAPDRKTTASTLSPLVTEIRKPALAELLCSLVRNGTWRARMSLRAVAPSPRNTEDRAGPLAEGRSRFIASASFWRVAVSAGK